MVTLALFVFPVWFASPVYVPVAVQVVPSVTDVGATVQLPLYAIVTAVAFVNVPAVVLARPIGTSPARSQATEPPRTPTAVATFVIVTLAVLLFPVWFASPAYVPVA